MLGVMMAYFRQNSSRGLTLIELVMTLAILAILATIAVPSIAELLKNNRMVGQATELVGVMTFARSEAIRRNAQILVDLSIIDSATWNVTVTDSGGNVLRDITNERVGLSEDRTFTFTNRGYLDPFNEVTFSLTHENCSSGRQRRNFTMERTGQFGFVAPANCGG